MSFTLERTKSKRQHTGPDPSFQSHLVRVLSERLADECVVLAHGDDAVRSGLQGAVSVGFQRVTYYLHCLSGGAHLSDQQRSLFAKLQRAGIRVEVVRTVSEAFQRVGDWGIPIKATDKWDARNLFKTEARKDPRRAVAWMA